MATTLWAMPQAGPSRFGPQVSHPTLSKQSGSTLRSHAQASETLTAMQSPSPSSSPAFGSNLPVPTASGGPGPSSLGHGTSAASTSESASTYSASVHSASVRSVSVHSTSIHSASVNSGRNLSSVFTRRGSHHNSGRRSKSVRSGQSNRSDGTADDVFEMVSLPTRAHGKKRLVQEHHEARIDRRKAEAAVAKWRVRHRASDCADPLQKWIVEQPPQAQHPLDANPIHSTSSFLFRAEHHPLRPPEGIPATTPPFSLSPSDPSPSQTRDATHHANTSSRGSLCGPSASGSPWNAEAGPSSSEGSHNGPAAPSTVGSNFMGSLVPGALDIYTTESVRALRNVELAVDPDWLAASSVSPLSRVRRLSTHPRVSTDMENPFSTIDTLLCRRRIRPLVLELVQALGAYIDAVWYTTYPDQACPWAGVPLSIAARRASVSPNAGAPPSKTWRSWTITAVQEGKRQGFMSCPPTEADVAFWGREIRYGLRDIDEAINRRKDLGWAFGETVIKGNYGDIVPSNVLTPGGKAANIPRLLNDLEEALW